MKDIMQLCDIIRETSFSLHKFLKNGHLEKVYENGLLINFGNPKLQIKKYILSNISDS